MVATDSIGKKGRAVRCASCKHEWFQKSEKDTLDDLISRIQAEEFDEIGFQDAGASAKASTSSGIPFLSGLVAKIASLRAQLNFWAFKKQQALKSKLRRFLSLFPRNKQDVKKLIGGSIAAIISFSVLGSSILLSHNLITNIFPETEQVFDKFGLKHTQMAINYNESLALDRMEYSPAEGSHGTAVIKGMMINLTAGELALPTLEINRLDGKGNVLHTQLYSFPEEKIEPEGQIDIEIALSEIPPIQVSARENIPHAQKIEVFYVPPHKDEDADTEKEADLPVPHDEKAAHEPVSKSTAHDLPKPFEGVPPSSESDEPKHNSH